MQERQPGSCREQVARDQAAEGERGRSDQQLRVGAARQPDGEQRERNGRRDKAAAGARAVTEVLRREGAVDAGADRAGDNDDVAADGNVHLTITVPSMSWRWSVQT